MSRLLRPRIAIPGVLVAFAAATSPQVAHAAATRAEYVAQVDPICHAAEKKESRAVRSLKKAAKRLRDRGIDTEELTKPVIRLGAHFYRQGAHRVRATNTQIAAVPAAPGDESIVALWLQKRRAVSDFLGRGARAFAHAKRRQVRKQISQAFKREFAAETVVRDFGFRYCSRVPPNSFD
jgi:hypothetical protein